MNLPLSTTGERFVSVTDVESVLKLAHDLADFPAAEIDSALKYLLGEMERLTGAEHVYWVAAVRDSSDEQDPLKGWRPAQYMFNRDLQDQEEITDYETKRLNRGDVDPFTQLLVNRAGEDRAVLQSEEMQRENTEEHWYFQWRKEQGFVGDRILGACTLNDNAECYVGVERLSDTRDFTQRERELLRTVFISLKWFFAEVMRSYGHIDATTTLTPRERDVLLYLLTDRSEKEIAQELGVSVRTVHQYVVSLYRKFNVNGRPALMALWLRYRRPPVSM